MDRMEQEEQLIEIGVASIDTRGGSVGILDTKHGQDLGMGISDD